MKHFFVIFWLLLFCNYNSFCQKRKLNDQLGLSIPILYNNTKILNVYRGARANYVSGNALSYGINLNYSRAIRKGFFVTVGIGYFNQNFGILRNFDFNGDSTKFGYATKRYSYNSVNWILGPGYCIELNKNYSLHGSLLFNGLYSFRQKYIPNTLTNLAFKKYQVETRSFSFGQMLNLNLGTSKKISQRLSIAADIVLPVSNRWRKDRIFRENEGEYNSSRFCVGTNLSVKYNLKH